MYVVLIDNCWVDMVITWFIKPDNKLIYGLMYSENPMCMSKTNVNNNICNPIRINAFISN